MLHINTPCLLILFIFSWLSIEKVYINWRYYLVGFVKNVLKIDDTLDVFAVHGVGGLLSTILLAPLVSKNFFGSCLSELSIFEQLYVQTFTSLSVALYTGLLTLVILIAIKKVACNRVSSYEEEVKLGQSSHSESSYN